MHKNLLVLFVFLTAVLSVVRVNAQSYKGSCIASAGDNLFLRPGFVLGYAYGLGGLVPLNCIDVSWECRNGSSNDVYTEIANLHVTGPIGYKVTILSAEVVGRDKDLIKLRVTKYDRPRGKRKVTTPIRLIRHAGNGSYPRSIQFGVKCNTSAPQELAATLKVKYRLSHSVTSTYTKSYELY